MSTTGEIKICELFTVLEDDWRKLYDSSFPANERESETKLAQLIAAGRMLYHKTIGKNGELLCFSMVSLAPDFGFLAYLATDPNQRSAGVGSKHMKRLLELLKEQFPGHEGMLLEIDATNPRKISITDEESKIRQRRMAFYRRLGARKLCSRLQFLGPARKSGGSDVELDLLFFSFSNEKLDCQTKKRLVSEIYQRFYCLDLDEPIVTTVMGQFGDCSSHAEPCPEEEDTASAPGGGTKAAEPIQPPVDPAPVVVPAPVTPPPAAVEPEPTPAPAPAGQEGPAATSPDASETDPAEVVVESDCEALEKLGQKVDCECQVESEAPGSNEAPPVDDKSPAPAPQPAPARTCHKTAGHKPAKPAG